jgi:hypothetical protein
LYLFGTSQQRAEAQAVQAQSGDDGWKWIS